MKSKNQNSVNRHQKGIWQNKYAFMIQRKKLFNTPGIAGMYLSTIKELYDTPLVHIPF